MKEDHHKLSVAAQYSDDIHQLSLSLLIEFLSPSFLLFSRCERGLASLHSLNTLEFHLRWVFVWRQQLIRFLFLTCVYCVLFFVFCCCLEAAAAVANFNITHQLPLTTNVFLLSFFLPQLYRHCRNHLLLPLPNVLKHVHQQHIINTETLQTVANTARALRSELLF